MQQEKIWDILAEQWSNFRNKPMKEVKWFIEKYITFNKKLKVLDVGCGNCRHLVPFAKNNCDCYGIDFSKNMLEQAKKYCNKENVKIKLKKADMRKLPFKDNYFDICLFVVSLHHLENNREKALKELYRVLKKDGIALLAVWNKWQLRFLFSKKDTFIPWNQKEKKHYRYYHLFNYFELRTLIKKSGFRIIKSKFGKNLVFVLKK